METHLTVFLEFFGLPGSGKSTISHMAADELRRQGKTVLEPTYDIDHRYSGVQRKARKMIRLAKYAVRSPGKYRKLRRIVAKNGYSGLDRLSQEANIASKLAAYRSRNADYVILDEGLVQSAIALGESDGNERALFGLCSERQVLRFYVMVDAETALLRMADRDQHDSRVEKMQNDEERLYALASLEDRCERALRSGNTVRIDAMQAAQSAVSDILKNVREREHRYENTARC